MLSNNGKCVKCNKYCLTCDPGNRNSCLTCPKGKALDTDDNTCKKCAKECETCSIPNDASSCILCSKGFKFNNERVCKKINKKYSSNEDYDNFRSHQYD